MLTIAEALAALAGPLAKLIESMTDDAYDPEKEKQALLDIERAAADQRARQALGG